MSPAVSADHEGRDSQEDHKTLRVMTLSTALSRKSAPEGLTEGVFRKFFCRAVVRRSLFSSSSLTIAESLRKKPGLFGDIGVQTDR